MVSVSVASRSQAKVLLTASPISRLTGARYASSHAGPPEGGSACALGDFCALSVVVASIRNGRATATLARRRIGFGPPGGPQRTSARAFCVDSVLVCCLHNETRGAAR